jgi:nitrogen-specific signal transduction histidine kinase
MKQRLLNISNLNSIIIVSLVTLLLFVSFAFFQNKREYNETISQAKLNLSRLTEIVSSNVEIGFISVDQTLRRAVERQYFNMLFGKSLKSDMEHNIGIWVNEVPHISALLIADKNAFVDIVVRKEDNSYTKYTNVQEVIKRHVDIHKELNNKDLYITSLSSEKDNQIIASRRLESLQGEFDGLVMAIIDGNHLLKILESSLNEQKVQLAVTHTSNTNDFLLVNDDSVSLFKDVISDFKSESAMSKQVMEKTIDNKFQLFSSHKLNDLPISVLLTIDESGIFKHLNAVKNQYYLFAAIFIVFTGIIITFAYFFDKQVKKSKNSENKALLASQAKSDFLAKMSHELRTPLNAIIGFSEMLSKDYFGKLSPQQTERITDINSCGNHLLELINDVLDFSKGDAGKLTLREEIVDIGKTVNSSIRIIEQKARSNGVNVLNAIEQKDIFIYADRRKIKQIIINLLSNAIKFTPEGGKITISCYEDKESNMVISVSDTGRGIDSKDIPKAMAVFEQVHGDDVDQGTGLGLPLCQMLTQMHGGAFKLESKVGQGTTAYVVIPHSRIRRKTEPNPKIIRQEEAYLVD